MHNDAVDLVIQRVAEHHRACPEAVEWASKLPSFELMWERCTRPAWILGLFDEIDYHDEGRLRLFAASCAQRNCDRVSDFDGDRFLAVARQTASGDLAVDVLTNEAKVCRRLADEALSKHWTTVRAAVIDSVCDTLRLSPLAAAMNASQNGQKASLCIVKEEEWQAGELRKLFGYDLSHIIKLGIRRVGRW